MTPVNTPKMDQGGLMTRIGIDVMKKAMKAQENEVLSVLQSAGAQPPQQQQQQQPVANNQAIAELTGLGQKIDIKG